MKIFKGQLVPIKSWCNNPEKGAVDQAMNLAKLPFIFKQVCLMPDTHRGYGMPIGGVIATKKVIIPNAVGVDIGCGMCAVKTDLTSINIIGIKEIMGKIRKVIPVGNGEKGSHKEPQYCDFMSASGSPELDNDYHPIINQQYDSALKQLGTLGGGNHFIEIQQDSEGYIWIMIHSGSRNLGYTVAKYYNKLAQKLCKQWYSNIPEYKGEDGLAFLPMETEEAKNYMSEMQYCVDFALANRKLMMTRIKEIFSGYCDCTFEKDINIAHNYARWENHFGQNVIVHRKGATRAYENEVGIIPGSQGTSSYIVKGKGNRESFQSCSHGAGRRMSRKEAKKTLNLEEEIKKMDDKGIVHGMRVQEELDESPGAYKDIDVVMEEQKDLVKILVKLEPLGVVKG